MSTHITHTIVDPPIRFRLQRANGETIEAELVGKVRVADPTATRRGEDLAGFMVRLPDSQKPTTVGQLVIDWGETIGLPDYP